MESFLMQANQPDGMTKINFPCEYLTNSSCSEIVSYLIRSSVHRLLRFCVNTSSQSIYGLFYLPSALFSLCHFEFVTLYVRLFEI